MRLRVVGLVVALLVCASGARGETAAEESGLCRGAIVDAEARWHTPPGLLLAIARAESGRPVAGLAGLQPWPWAIDADGAAMFSDSKAAAMAWTRQSGAHLIDVGCMQVNLQAHPSAFRSLEDAFDPTRNADYAGRFLSELAQEAGGNWFEAVGWYHSRTPDLAADYRERVAAIAAGRVPPPGRAEPLYLRAIQQGTLRLALAGGGSLVVRLNRQPSARGHRRKSPCEVAAILAPIMRSPARAGACGGVR